MKTILLILLLAGSAWGQDSTTNDYRDIDYWQFDSSSGTMGISIFPTTPYKQHYSRIPDRWTFEVECRTTYRSPITLDSDTITISDTTWTPKQPVYLSEKQIEWLTGWIDKQMNPTDPNVGIREIIK